MNRNWAQVTPWMAQAIARLRAWRPWVRSRKGVVTAMMVGERCLAVRLAQGGADGRLRVIAASRGSAEVMSSWRALAAGSTPVLVLGSAERQVLTLDRPPVPDEELTMAMRWPAATAQEADPDQLLCAALPLPQTSAAGRQQVLAFTGSLEAVKAQLERLRAARLEVRHVDVIDSALLGMLRLLGTTSDPNTASVSITTACGHLFIALMWQARFCALRTLALPVGRDRQDDAYLDALSLHIQRTVDSFERQATLLTVREVLLNLTDAGPSGREAVAASLPLTTRIFDLEHWVDMTPEVEAQMRGDEELHALACVAASRLLDAPAALATPAPVPAAKLAGGVGAVGTAGSGPPPSKGSLSPNAPNAPSAPSAPNTPADGQRASGKPADEWMLQP